MQILFGQTVEAKYGGNLTIYFCNTQFNMLYNHFTINNGRCEKTKIGAFSEWSDVGVT